MAVSNAELAGLLRSYAAVLKLEGVDRFKLKAYLRAADSVESTSDQIATLVTQGEDLTKLPGIGEAISEKLTTIVRTGKLPQLERALEKLDPAMAELAARPALDPSTVKRAYKKFGIKTLKELEARLESGELRRVMGSRAEFSLRQGLDVRPRMLFRKAERLEAVVRNYLIAQEPVDKVITVGSMRRKQDTVGDLNFIVLGKSATRIFQAFAELGAVHSWEPDGKSQATFTLSEGRRVTLVWSKAATLGVDLLTTTGSQAHLADLNQRSKLKKRSLTPRHLGKVATSEEAIYQALGLRFVEPELREGRGEVDAASSGNLPELITLDDLRGDLHMHTVASDGAGTIEEMADAAQSRGYSYIAITDHSQSLKLTNGLTEKRLRQQNRVIDKINSKRSRFTILKSAEVDILQDGSLDYSHAILKELDFTICSIHSKFALGREQQTERIMRAMDNPYFTILGHATGRLLLRREGYEIDFERVLAHAKKCGCYFEINSNPNRLDLSDKYARMAIDAGVKLAINTDAHSTSELEFMPYGVNQARRAWVQKADVLNALPLSNLRTRLKR